MSAQKPENPGLSRTQAGAFWDFQVAAPTPDVLVARAPTLAWCLRVVSARGVCACTSHVATKGSHGGEYGHHPTGEVTR